MRLGKFEHLEPRSLEEACTLLSEHRDEARVIAGGTDILLRMKQRLVVPKFLVDIKQVEGLNEIRIEGDEIRIGAVVTLTDIQKSPAILKQYPALVQAAGAVGAAQLQNMGTIGGNLCLDTRCWYYNQSHAWRQGRAPCFKSGGKLCHMVKGSRRCYALYSGDTAAVLLALEAKIRLVSPGKERLLPLKNFFGDDGNTPTVLQPDELMAEVIIPAPPRGQLSTYLKFRRREAIDFPIAGVAVSLTRQNGILNQVNVGLTGVGSSPCLAEECSAILTGKSITTELIHQAADAASKQVKPVSHMEVSPAYRKRLVRVLVQDAILKLLNLTDS